MFGFKVQPVDGIGPKPEIKVGRKVAAVGANRVIKVELNCQFQVVAVIVAVIAVNQVKLTIGFFIVADLQVVGDQLQLPVMANKELPKCFKIEADSGAARLV